VFSFLSFIDVVVEESIKYVILVGSLIISEFFPQFVSLVVSDRDGSRWTSMEKIEIMGESEGGKGK
jgi:hypothetical protein